MNIPNTTGTVPPVLRVPANACDAHLHIYDARFATVVDAAQALDRATVSEYRQLQQRLGTTRAVIVTPRSYGTDNRVTVDAIDQLGIKHARGVAVLRTDVTNAQIRQLDQAGIKGIRFSLYTPTHAAASFDMVEELSHRVEPFGWHLQLHWTADQFIEHEAMLKRLPSRLVIDHMGRLPQPAGINHPAVHLMHTLLDRGRTWIKLSGPYLDSKTGERGEFRDIDDVPTHWIKTAPERLVWGSDWPHPTEGQKPDDAKLLDLITRWTESEAVIKQILVSNPAALYGFD
jgi:predicted TIM-barrel fold metal-dependent hydrolase